MFEGTPTPVSLEDIQLDIVVNLQGDSRIDSFNRKLRGTAQAVDGVVRSSDAMASVNRRMIRSWEDLTTQLSNVERKYDALFRAGVHMTQMGHDLLGVSEKLVATGLGLVDAYAGYDMMLRRGAVALNTNAVWQERLDEAIQDTAITLGAYEPEEVAEAYYIWGAAAGIVVDTEKELADITGVVRDVLIATAMAGGSLETNLKGVYGILSVFNLPMERASDVTRTLALMTERTAADFGDLVSAFSYVGPLAESIGISFEDVTQILGVLADSGQRGSRAGRGLSMVLEGMASPSGPAKEALDGVTEAAFGLGTTFADITFPEGDFVGMTGFIQNMALSVEDLTDAERGRLYSVAFTNNATRALIPLIEEQVNLNEEAARTGKEWISVLDQEKYQLGEVEHFFAGMTAQFLGSINSITGAFRNSFFPILQLVATRIMEMAIPVMDRITGMVKVFGEWLEQNPEIVDLAVRLGALAAAVAAVAGVFFLFGGAASLVIANLGNFTQGIGRIIAPFAGLALVVGGLVTLIMTNFGGLRAAFQDLGDAVADFVAALDLDGVSFTEVLEGLWALAEPRIEQAVRSVADAVEWLANKIRDLTGNDEFMEWASEAAGWIVTIMTVSFGLRAAAMMLGTLSGAFWAFGLVWSGVTKLLMAGAIMGTLRTLGGIVSGLAGAFMALATPLKFLIGGLTIVGLAIGAAFLAYETNFLGFRDFVNGIIEWLVTTVPGVIQNVIGFFQQVGANIASTWQQVWSVVQPILVGIAAPIVALAQQGIPALIARLQEFWASVQPIFLAIRDTAIEVFNNVLVPAWNSLIEKVKEFVGFVGPLLTEFVSSFIAFMTPIVEFLRFVLPIAWEYLVEVTGKFLAIMSGLILAFVEVAMGVIGPWVEAVIRIVGVLWETAVGLFRAGLDIIMGIFQTVFGTLSEIFKAFAALFKGDLGTFWDHVTGAFVTAVDGILRIIGGLISGIWTAFTGMVGVVWELITGFLAGILGLFPEFIQDIIKWGGDIVKGLWEGISNFVKWLWGKITGFLGDIVDKVKEFFGIKSPSTVFANIGENIVRGIWSGISNLAQWLWDKVSAWVGGIVDNVLAFFKISSPSTVFADIGENLVKGMALGIDATPDAVRSMDRYAQQILDIGAAMETTSRGFTTEFETQAGLSVESSNDRTVRIELDLTSSDGSYDNATLEQLKAALTGSDLVRALERMAEAD